MRLERSTVKTTICRYTFCKEKDIYVASKYLPQIVFWLQKEKYSIIVKKSGRYHLTQAIKANTWYHQYWGMVTPRASHSALGRTLFLHRLSYKRCMTLMYLWRNIGQTQIDRSSIVQNNQHVLLKIRKVKRKLKYCLRDTTTQYSALSWTVFYTWKKKWLPRLLLQRPMEFWIQTLALWASATYTLRDGPSTLREPSPSQGLLWHDLRAKNGFCILKSCIKKWKK